MKIVCTLSPDFFSSTGISFPEEWALQFIPFKSEALEPALADADCWFASSLQPLTEERLSWGKKLKLVQTLGVGYDKIALAYLRGRGVYACNGRGTNGVAVAEHAVGLMLTGLRRVGYYERQVFEGKFREAMRGYDGEGLHELGSRKVGLLGLGENGGATAGLLRAFGCEVYYHKRRRAPQEREEELRVRYLPFDELISSCNVLSLHVPSSPETVGMIGAREFGMMRRDTLLVNVARGEIVDTAALVEALIGGRIFGAALDTTYPEPPAADHPLLNLPLAARDRLTLTPHIAGVTAESKAAALRNVIGNIRCVERGERPKNIVNGLL